MANRLPNVAESEQSVVTLKVGPRQKVFIVHTEMICNKSEFFKHAFESNFKEGKQQVMLLEDTEEDVFKIVMQYLYTHQLPGFLSKDQGWGQKLKTDDEGNKELEWDFLMSSAYIFAKMYAISNLSEQLEILFMARFATCNSTATTMNYPSMATIIRVFNGVPEDSRLCELFVQSFAQHWRPKANETIDKHLFQQLPLNFALLAMEALAKRRDEAQSKQAPPKKDFFSTRSTVGDSPLFGATSPSFTSPTRVANSSPNPIVSRPISSASQPFGSFSIRPGPGPT